MVSPAQIKPAVEFGDLGREVGAVGANGEACDAPLGEVRDDASGHIDDARPPLTPPLTPPLRLAPPRSRPTLCCDDRRQSRASR